MKKGYLVANIRITDAETFQTFSGMAAPAIQKYGGKFYLEVPWLTGMKGISLAQL